jgi:hypothetical protein
VLFTTSLIGGALFYSTNIIKQANGRADAALQKQQVAELAAQNADARLQTANEALGAARTETEREQAIAKTAQDAAKNATERAGYEAGLAASRSLANRSETMLREKPEDLLRSTSLALAAMDKSLEVGVHGIEADTALRDALAMLTKLRRSARYDKEHDGFPPAGLSPDGRYFAVLYQGRDLRIYESSDPGPLDAQKPVKEVECVCSQIAVSSDLHWAGGVTQQGVLVFELTGSVRSRLLPIKEVAPYPIMALSPGGRYLAMTFDSEGRRHVISS